VDVPPPTSYLGLNYDGVNVNVNNGGVLPIRITDVLTRDGSNYIASAPLGSINISVADPLATFAIQSLSVGMFLQTAIPLARPAMNGRVYFFGAEPNSIPGLSSKTEFVQFTGTAHTALLQPGLEAGGFVLVGAYSMQFKTLNNLNNLRSVQLWPTDTTLSIGGTVGQIDLARVVGGIFLDNITYTITTPA
jgi:hypothetical protein